MKIERGIYGEIKVVSPRIKKQITNLISDIQNIDEHDGWEFGAEFDSKGRGSALNWDLYGHGRDLHSQKFLALIQIRQWEKRTRRGFARVRKNYFLMGRNEDSTIFAHPVQSQVIHRAIRDNRNVIRAVQSWIFGCDYAEVIRQGDVAFVPMKRINARDSGQESVTVVESHFVTGNEIRENGDAVYILNPTSTHPTHPMVFGDGWYKIVVGKRADYWKFAAPTKD